MIHSSFNIRSMFEVMSILKIFIMFNINVFKLFYQFQKNEKKNFLLEIGGCY